MKEDGPSRASKVVIATKVLQPDGGRAPNQRGLSRKHIRHSIDESLRRLGTRLRRPLPDPPVRTRTTPIEETLDALDRRGPKAGKALYGRGVVHVRLAVREDVEQASDRLGLARFVDDAEPLQPGLSRGGARDDPPLPVDEGIGLIPWSPLARGFLAGNRGRGEDKGETSRARTDDFAHKLYYNDGDFKVVDRLTEVARARGVSNARVALAWILQQPGVTSPIIGASKMPHLDDALAALELKLDDAELKSLAEPYQPHPILGHS